MDFEKYFDKKTPITEQSNEITKNIDLASESELIELFSKTDAQLFNGWQIDETTTTNGLFDSALLSKIDSLSQLIAKEYAKSLANNTSFKVVLSGCGTSGRLAYVCSQSVNEHLKSNLCAYIIAGGDYALIHSVEAVEDSPKSGQETLKAHMQDTDRVVLIAITCGLSAPFIAGQLELFLNDEVNKEKLAGVALIGFNTASLARTNEIYFESSGCIKTFSSLLSECLLRENFYFLNALVGPEPITGSSRMKSGSATKMILDLTFAPLFNENVASKRLLEIFKQSLEFCIYGNEENRKVIEKILKETSKALKANSSVNYLSDRKKVAILCCIDASECLPTFGAELHQIQGFVNAQSELYWNEIDMFSECKIDSEEFKNAVDDSNSLFIEVSDLEDELIGKKSNKMSLRSVFERVKEFLSEQDLSELSSFIADAILFINLKICCNIISTGSFVLYGKVYKNYMIDVKTSNRKLYLRAIGLIKLLTNEDYEKCESCLLRAIYACDDVSHVQLNDVSKHIETAKASKFVVPKALIMCATNCLFDEATKQLEASNAIRNSIDAILKKQQLN